MILLLTPFANERTHCSSVTPVFMSYDFERLFRRGEIVREDILKLLSARKGHFLLESGHHGDLWLDLESLCLRPSLVRHLTVELADRLAGFGVDAVCGPLVEGAFIGLLVAGALDVEFTYSERFARPSADGLYPAGYRVPPTLRDNLRGRRVAIVNDVINAGSAVRGTFADLRDCGTSIVAIASLLVLGQAATEFASAKNLALISLASLDNNLWTAAECPLCASGQVLEDPGHFASSQSVRA